MKTPDRIYIHTSPHLGLLEATAIKVNAPGEQEYIRKDALLEWVKEQKKDCERVIREHPEDESLWCERDKYDELIDKLNSM